MAKDPRACSKELAHPETVEDVVVVQEKSHRARVGRFRVHVWSPTTNIQRAQDIAKRLKEGMLCGTWKDANTLNCEP